MSQVDFRDEEDLGQVYDRALFRWLLGFARPHAAAIAGCTVLLLGLAALQLAQPYVIKLAIDGALAPTDPALAAAPPEARLARLWPLVLVYLLLVIGSAGLQYLQALWLGVTGQKIVRRIRSDVYAHLQRLGLAFFDRQPTGRLVTRVTNDVEALNEMYTSVLVNLFRDAFVLVGGIWLLFRLDARLAAVVLVAMPVVALVAWVFGRLAREGWRRMRLELAQINASLAETFSGIRVIQLFGREARGAEEFRAINDRYFGSALHVIRVFAVFGPALDLITGLALAAVIGFGGASVLAGAISFGTLYAFTAYLRRLFEPINDLAQRYNILQSALASGERLSALMDLEPEIRDPEQPAPLVLPAPRVQASPSSGSAPSAGTRSPAPPAVAFDRVWFAYDGDEWILKDLSFEVAEGETVAFVGATGAGKSTIMNLIPRFYDVRRGAVRVFGRDLRDLSQDSLRRAVGTVMQDVFLFAGDVAGNIDLGDPSISRAMVERAGAVVGADRFIRRLPGGFDERVVERGLSLSTGERQLIAFARALAFDPPILVLDEATASVDTETELALQQALSALTRGRTVLIVAHRLATVREADRIYVMHQGRIAESGSHDALLAQDGLYRRLWRLQFEAEGADPLAG